MYLSSSGPSGPPALHTPIQLNTPGLLFVASVVWPPPIESPATARLSLLAITRKCFSTNGITSWTRLCGYDPSYRAGARGPRPAPSAPGPRPSAACTGGGGGAVTDCRAGVGP